MLSTVEINELSAHAFAKGSLANSDSFSFSSTKRYVLKLTPTISMLPKADVVIYYISKRGDIISDKVPVEFIDQFMNHLDLKLSKEEDVGPGENVEISINTQPNAIVGLLGVDQSVLLVKRGNDLEKSAVFEELDKYYDVHMKGKDEGQLMREDGRDFYNSQGIIITNAYKPTSNFKNN